MAIETKKTLCTVCKMRKENVVTVGKDSGGGFGNHSVCGECLPMFIRGKKEKK